MWPFLYHAVPLARRDSARTEEMALKLESMTVDDIFEWLKTQPDIPNYVAETFRGLCYSYACKGVSPLLLCSHVP